MVSKKLTRASKEYPTAESCRLLADGILAPINRKQSVPESSLPLHEFVDLFYFPAVEHELKPSTIVGYKSLYAAHLKHKPELKLSLRDMRTVHIQRLLRGIDGVGHLTLSHIKNFLSGVFKWAKQEGYLDGMNPCVDVKVPGRLKKVETAVYSIQDCENMIEWIESHEYDERLKHNEDAPDVDCFALAHWFASVGMPWFTLVRLERKGSDARYLSRCVENQGRQDKESRKRSDYPVN